MQKINLTIKQKFVFAGVLAFTSMMAILGLGLYTSNNLKAFGDVSLSISEVEAGMLMLRRNEKDFLARKDIKYKGKFKTNYDTLQSRVNKLSSALDIAGLESQPAKEITTTLNNYNSSFNNVIRLQQKIGLNSKDGLYGSLREAVHDAETKIKELDDQQLRADMLQLRRNEKDFMLRHKTKYLDKFNKNFDVFIANLDASEHSGDEKEAIQDLMKQYKDRFSILVKTNQEKGLTSKEGLLGKMRATVHETEALLKKLSKELATTVELEVGSLDGLMVTTSLIALVLAILVIAIIAWISMGILRPMQTLATTMTCAANDHDLSLRMKVSSKDEIGETGTAFNTMLGDFQGIVGQVSGSATQMSSAAEELSAITQAAAYEIQEQTSQTDQVATAITEMSATVQEVARNASEAAVAANETTDEANNGRQVVVEAIDSMNQLASEIEQAGNVINKLEEDGVKIGAVLDVIRGIAEQTNLLALNAAIEAARAGEQGRGFAVVADEVRTLASRTQESTQEIQQMIERLQSGTKAAVDAMDSSRSQAQSGVEKISTAGEALSTIVSGITRINDMNTQIASASEEQSVVAEEINQNVVKISEIAANSSANAGQTQHSSDELSRLSVELQGLVSQFKS